ncbi:MAG: 3-deoxy-D-manno-octulosonic acid transferase [Candidatus Omnitrophota bacterium]
MILFYNFIFLIIAVIYFVLYLLRGKFHRGFMPRLGIMPRGLALDRPIWIHAVSVGEAVSVKAFIESLRKAYPDKKLVISTVTPSGNKIAKTIARNDDFVTYLPLDFSFTVKAGIGRINPFLFIIVETEIWPNLISYLYTRDIPIIVINGRISDRSFRKYRMIRWLLKPILNRINLWCVQSSLDAQRLISLGLAQDKVKVTGNMKFDNTDCLDFKKSDDGRDLKIKLGLTTPGSKLLVAGSTHPGEEEIILKAYKKLLSGFPQLKLLIAPRHPERAKEIERIVSRYGVSPIRVSQLASLPVCQLNQSTGQPVNRQTVLILDTIGELMSFYRIADIVFVGGSLIKKGGHNILEPASLAKPILFGPYMFNFRDITELFLKDNACILVHNEEELYAAIKELLDSPSKIASLGRKARDLIGQNQGAINRNLELIKKYFYEKAGL